MHSSTIAVSAGLILGSMAGAIPAKADPLNPPLVNRAAASSTSTFEKLFDDWMLKCTGGVCQVFLTLADEITKEAKLSWSFVYDPKTAKLSTIVQLPLMAALPPG